MINTIHILYCHNDGLDVYMNNYKVLLKSDINVAYAGLLSCVEICDLTGLLYEESRDQYVLVGAELPKQSFQNMLYSLVCAMAPVLAAVKCTIADELLMFSTLRACPPVCISVCVCLCVCVCVCVCVRAHHIQSCVGWLQ